MDNKIGSINNPESIDISEKLPFSDIMSCDIVVGAKYYWEQFGEVFCHVFTQEDFEVADEGEPVLLRNDTSVNVKSSKKTA